MANWEVVLEGRQATADMLTVLHYNGTGVTPPDFAAAASVIKGHLTDHIQVLCGSRVTWLGLTVREDIVGGVGTFVPFPTGTLTGTAVDADQMDMSTMLVRKVTGSLVRPTNGWVLQGGLSVRFASAAGIWEPAATAAVALFWEDMRILNISGPSVLTMQIKARNPTAPNTQAYTVVNSVVATATPRALRTRLTGSGS